MKPKNVCIVGSAQRLHIVQKQCPITPFQEKGGGGGGGPGLVDTSIGKFRREARGHGRSVPVKCNFIHEMGMEKGEV